MVGKETHLLTDYCEQDPRCSGWIRILKPRKRRRTEL
jgi:hypothetical protein